MLVGPQSLKIFEKSEIQTNLVKSCSGHHEKNVGLQMVYQNDHSVISRGFYNFGFDKMIQVSGVFNTGAMGALAPAILGQCITVTAL